MYSPINTYNDSISKRSINAYRYGFNGMERDDEVKGGGNSYDFGARMLDSRLGRWLSIDPLQHKYPDFSPYSFVANTPIKAVDPDGRLIIFINGLWGWPNDVGEGGTSDYWGGYKNPNSWLWQAIHQISPGDNPKEYDKAIFRDGSMGGTTLWPSWRSSLSASDREDAGYDQGYSDAEGIIKNLDEGESIKYVTNSMGAAYQRGHSEGIKDYVNDKNKEIMAHNAEIDKQVERLKAAKARQEAEGYILGPTEMQITDNDIRALELQKQPLLKMPVIEFVIDLDPHQETSSDPNAEEHFYMQSRNYNWAESLAVDPQPVKGAEEIKDIKGRKAMSRHHSSGAPIKLLPKAKN